MQDTVAITADEVKRLRSENESLRDDVDTLKGDVESLKGDVKALLKSREKSPDTTVATMIASGASDETPNVNPPAATGIAAKKRNKKKNKKRGNKVANYWDAAGESVRKVALGTSSSKIAVGFMSVALLISMAVGQGIIGKTAPQIWEHKGGQSPKKFNKAVDSATKMGHEVKPRVKLSLPSNRGDREALFKETSLQREQKSIETINSQKHNVTVESSEIYNEESSSAKVPVFTNQANERIIPKTSHEQDTKQSDVPQKQNFDQSDGTGYSRKSEVGLSPQNLHKVIDSTGIDGRLSPTSEMLLSAEMMVAETTSSPQKSRRKFKNILKKLARLSKMKSRKEEPPSKIPLLGRTGLLSRSLQVNSSPPTTSSTDFAPTTTPTYQEITETIVLNSGYVCDPNPETCGCPALLLTDYRGSINTTADGLQCEKWPDDIMQAYPNGGIVENYCRNPVNDQGGPFCFVRTGPDDLEIGFCDVPICAALTAPPTVSAVPTSSTRPTGSPSSSSLPSSSSSPTQHCLVADNEVCGCEAVQQSDYRGTISTTVDGLVCERWDSELVGILKLFGFDLFGEFPNAGLDENFCRNPGNNEDGPYCFTPEIDENNIPIEGHCNIPKCDPCACTPQCGEPNPESCACPSFFQADSCCNEDDAMCKCRYLKDACRISLENNSTDFCDDAEDACCEGKGEESHSYCKCNMYEQICSDAPSQATCDFAASSCCESEHDVTESNNRCLCDFYTHSAIFFESAFKIGNCSSPNANEGFTVPGLEKILLENLYFLCEGENWFDDTGWLDDTIPHCQWFGLKCNDEGLLVEINLRNNNLTGIADYLLGGVDFPRLTKLDVGGNQLTGKLRSADINRHRRLVYIDISENNFSGHADMTFPPTTLHANYSHNNFASVSFKRFNPVYETLQVVDLSHNRISQYTSEIFLNIPHNLRELILSNNQLKGPLPDPFPLEDVRRFVIANNSINGDLPYFPTPLLRELDLSDQNQAENGGLTGTVRDDHLENLEAIYLLNLAGNKLSGDIPSSLGVKQYLQVLNLSSNALDKSIPTELGKLKDVLEVLDLSTNELTGTIPLELANLDGALVQLHLSGNNISSNPVPLDLCFLTGFDLAKDAELCPPERNALKNFYDSAKGGEWTESKSWLDPVTSHCDWYGVSCNDQSNHAIKLELRNNGLSGKLSEKIAALTSLEVLDLSDNGIKGMIPAAVGNLANLKYLRLCYNEFIGDQTNFENLQHLELVQIQGNRLSGSIPSPNMLISGPSSFVSDCGNPSEFGESLVCDDCSMCCNAQGDCFSTEENHIQKVGINKHVWFSLLFIACLFAASGALALVVYAHDKYQHQSLPRSSSRIDRDEKYALSTIGEDSVYQFFLGKNISGWIIVLLTLAAQTWLLFIFVKSAESDWTDDGSALVYTWKCPRDKDECEDSGDVDWTGWLAFTILMAAHLLKDVINGTKLILLSAKERHDRHTRMRFFIGGTLLATVASFTFYVSAIYNAAIATDNREIIENSVIILFICDIDELLFDILMVANQGWVNGMLREEKQEEEPASETVIQEKVDEEGGLNRDLEHYANDNVASEDQFVNDKNLVGTVEHLTKAVKTLQETVKQQNEQLRLLLNCRESAAEC